MLTPRGWWFVLLVLTLLAAAGLAPPRGQPTLALVGLTLLLWFAWEWLSFSFRARRVARRLVVEREIHDDRGRVDTLWAGRSYQVRVALRLEGWGSLPYVIALDRVPFGAERLAGDIHRQGAVSARQPLELSYRIECPTVGRIRFEGLAVQLSDLQGFFHLSTFRHAVVIYRVLPHQADVEGRTAGVKRHNLLPPPGTHRHRRPGSGSELLDLRDYLPGDPPKLIAWKASARRDRLITKEFESEVPVRCTLFVDRSNSVRLGPPGQNALSRLVEIAAVVAQAAVGSRDLVGLCLFDEAETTSLRPARSGRHLAQVINLLTDSAGLAPTTGEATVPRLMPLAHGLAQEVYPELLRPEVNAFPWWLPWLCPRPAWTIRWPSLADRLYRWLPCLVPAYLVVGLVLVVLAIVMLTLLLAGARASPVPFAVLLGLSTFGLVLAYLSVPLFGFFPGRRRAYRWRKQLAAVLAVRHGLGPGGLGILLEDNEQFAQHLQRFLAEHHVPYSLPLYDRRGRYLFASPEKVEVLSRALLQAVGRGHDNELFVLLADLLELEEELGPLLKAVKVALARHHRVVVVCPWPVGVPLPGRRRDSAGQATEPDADSPPGARLPELLAVRLTEATTTRYHQAYQRLRRSFGRLGVPLVCARSDEPVPLILDHLDRLRNLGRVR